MTRGSRHQTLDQDHLWMLMMIIIMMVVMIGMTSGELMQMNRDLDPT